MKLYQTTIRYLFTVIVILAFVFITTGLYDRKINKDINLMNGTIDNILEEIGDLDDNDDIEDPTRLAESGQALQEYWEKHCVDSWGYFLFHATIKEVDIAIAKLREYSEMGLYGSAKAEIATLRRQFVMIRDHDKLSLTNIL